MLMDEARTIISINNPGHSYLENSVPISRSCKMPRHFDTGLQNCSLFELSHKDC